MRVNAILGKERAITKSSQNTSVNRFCKAIYFVSLITSLIKY